MATTNYGLEEINKATDILSPDPINRNMVKIDTYMATNALNIQTVAEQVATIDVTTNVEEVVNRRVNTDRTKALNTIIGEIKDAIVTAITTARDNIKTHVTSEHTSSKSTLNTAIVSARDNVNTNVNSQHATTNAAITSARDSVNANVDAEHVSTRNLINELKTLVNSKASGDFVGKKVDFNTYRLTIAPSTSQTVFEYSVKGTENLVMLGFANGGGYSSLMRMYVDGVLKYDGLASEFFGYSASSDRIDQGHNIAIPFSSSIKVEAYSTGGYSTTYFYATVQHYYKQ